MGRMYRGGFEVHGTQEVVEEVPEVDGYTYMIVDEPKIYEGLLRSRRRSRRRKRKDG